MCVMKSSQSTHFCLFQVNWNISFIFVLISIFFFFTSGATFVYMTTRTTYSFRVTEVADIFGCKSSGVLRFCRLILSLSGSSSDFVYFWCSDVLNVSAMVRHRHLLHTCTQSHLLYKIWPAHAALCICVYYSIGARAGMPIKLFSTYMCRSFLRS